MVFSLSANLGQAQGAVSVVGCIGEHFEEIRLADMVGTGARDQYAAGADHLQGTQIQLLVAAEGGLEVALALGEGGRIEDDGVVALPGR